MSEKKQLYLGLNLDSINSQLKPGQYSYGLNGVVSNFDGNSYIVQNEQGTVLCTNFPAGYKVIGGRNIIEKNLIIFFLASPTGDSEIGVVDTNTCLYTAKINDPCLNFSFDRPILKIVYKVTPFSTEIYWADPIRRYLDLENLPYKEIPGVNSCDFTVLNEIDCNKLAIQPNFSIPQIELKEVTGDGETEAGAYEFGIAYSNALSEAYTSYYSITNPLSLFDPNKITADFNYKVNKSINIKVTKLDVTGYYDYFNLVVIKTVNNISTPYLVGTYKIVGDSQIISYTGQNKTEINLTMIDVIEKYPIYETAKDVTTAQDILIWADLTTNIQVNYQKIWSKVSTNWITHRLRGKEAYAEEINTANKKGYFRDEIYALEGCFLLANGYQTDSFHIPGRVANQFDLELILTNDVPEPEDTECSPPAEPRPRWQVYNTGSKYETRLTECPPDDPECIIDPCYEGSWEWGDFSYWESTERYPCDPEIWGDDSDKPIRHHKFPDSTVTHIHDNQGYIYPIGVQIDHRVLSTLIRDSDLTPEQKAQIVGYKITRGNRANNKSVVARGLLNNVGLYNKDGTYYYYPNYPYNDLRADPFISSSTGNLTGKRYKPTASQDCAQYNLFAGATDTTFSYTTCDGDIGTITIPANRDLQICSKTTPTGGSYLKLGFCDATATYTTINTPWGSGTTVIANLLKLNGFDPINNKRYVFHSPDTHFYQPTLGNILKLETAEFGKSEGHFQEVKKHAKHKLISVDAFMLALTASVALGFAAGSYGAGSVNVWNGTTTFTAYKIFMDLIDKIIPFTNFTYQFNSIGNYTDFEVIENTGNKQRTLDIATYAIPGVLSVGDIHNLNNYQRESSVYLRTVTTLPPVSEVGSVPEDNSRWTLSEEGMCNTFTQVRQRDISSYYGTIKKNFTNQYGQLYSYETIDTGFQQMFDVDITLPENRYRTVFGGDCFINRFAYKTKLPFFIDNRVNFPDGSDIFFNEIGNVGNPLYWFSTDVDQTPFKIGGKDLSPFFALKIHNLDCPESKHFSSTGKMYLFAYGIPNFFCESEVNVDMRQAYNGTEGDFFPRVSTGIPDDWLQEKNTSINYDNTYTYNKSYSKQNKENSFSHLPEDFSTHPNRHVLHYRAIFSERQNDVVNYRRNNWLVYRPAAKFDFPQNFGLLSAVDGIDNQQVLARFENKTLLYNALLTAPTSAGQVYLGQSLFSSNTPPLDYGDTDLGYAGSQHKFLLKTEFGIVSTDAKRGQVFLIQGQQAKEISNETVSKFMLEYLPFQIQKHFPAFPIDNHFMGVGLHGVYDADNKRFVMTKLDYIPNSNVTWTNNKFMVGDEEVTLGDPLYFCNNSFTISYSFLLGNWVFFHTYLPNYYIGNPKGFYSGEQNGLWKHGDDITIFNNYYGTLAPYIIEYPYAYNQQDEILQSVSDYSKILQYTDWQSFVETDDYYFNKAIIYSNQQCSGILELTKKPARNLSLQSTYPKYNADSKEILYVKSDSFYNFNTFWDLIKDPKQPIWKKSCESVSIFKEINQSNMSYSKRAYRKAPIRSKELKIRLINDKYDTLKFLSSFLIDQTAKSYK